MFSGTVRSNLDPFGEYGHDAMLWEAIKDCGLEDQVRRAEHWCTARLGPGLALAGTGAGCSSSGRRAGLPAIAQLHHHALA